VPDSIDSKLWKDLTTEEVYEFLRLRCNVFMWEQKADDEEMDGRDLEPTTVHWWISDDRGCAAYLRVLWNDIPEHRDAHRVVGRVAVRADRRGDGLARRLMEGVVAQLDAAGEAAMLHAQDYVVGLYERFGFEAFGEPYDEAGIPHLSMYRPARGDAQRAART